VARFCNADCHLALILYLVSLPNMPTKENMDPELKRRLTELGKKTWKLFV
jgi:hypothetical protein